MGGMSRRKTVLWIVLPLGLILLVAYSSYQRGGGGGVQQGQDTLEIRSTEEARSRLALRMLVLTPNTGLVIVDSDRFDGACIVPQVSQPITLGVPTGKPVNGQRLPYVILAQRPQPLQLVSGPLGFSTEYGVELPPTTPTDGALGLIFRWNATEQRWGLIVAQEITSDEARDICDPAKRQPPAP